MYLISGEARECFGCFACKDVCPADAIESRQSSDTFLYPYIDQDKCIDCKRCEQVCPQGSGADLAEPLYCFSGIIKDQEAFKKCSSGGAFEAIIRSIFSAKGENHLFVAGAVWDNDFHVVHKLIEIKTVSDIEPFYKSKYVQSNPTGIYREVQETINDSNNIVVFSGAPCQVAALINYLGKKADNLLTIDLVCHGAPSQFLFDQYKEELESEYGKGSKLLDYKFRNKEILDNGTLYTRSAKYTFENGESRKVTRFTDSFLKAFYEQNDWTKETCLGCKFKQPSRIGDFTIGDSWGIEKKHPDIHGIRGVSLITFNSADALKYRDTISALMNIYEIDYHFLIENNPSLYWGGNTLCNHYIQKIVDIAGNIHSEYVPFHTNFRRKLFEISMKRNIKGE